MLVLNGLSTEDLSLAMHGMKNEAQRAPDRMLREDLPPEQPSLNRTCSSNAMKERLRLVDEQQAIYKSRQGGEGGHAQFACAPIENPSHYPNLQLAYSTGGNSKAAQNSASSKGETKVSRPLRDGVTLIVPVHISRLFILEDICRMWQELPVAATIYVPTHGGIPTMYNAVDDAILDVKEMERRLEENPHDNPLLVKIKSKGACRLSLEVYTEDTCGLEGKITPEPINAMKNKAMQLVETQGVIITDGEHLLNSGLMRQLHKRSVREKLTQMAEQYHGVLIPSFVPVNGWFNRISHQLAQELARTRYHHGIVKLVQSNQLTGPEGWGLDPKKERAKAFQAWRYDQHGFNYTRLGDGSNPIVFMLTSQVPFFDESLRGVGWSAALHARHMEAMVQTPNVDTWAMYGEAWAIRMAPMGQKVIKSASKDQASFMEDYTEALSEAENFNRNHYFKWREAAMSGTYVPTVSSMESC